MNKFETVLTDITKGLLIAGSIAGPVFIHSTQGIAVLNASEETAAALLTAATTPPAQPAAPPAQ